MIKLKELLSEGSRINFIDNRIKNLELEWDRLDSQGTGHARQMEIRNELSKLKKEKENWERIYTNINENEDISIDEIDDWNYYIRYELSISKDILLKLYNKFDLKAKNYLKNTVIKIWDKNDTMYLEYDADTETADLIKDIVDWVYNFNNYSSLPIGTDELYNGHVDSTLKDLMQNPGKVYHYTTDEGWNNIKQHGKIIGSYGTGINNRSAHGIFTSVDPEEYALGSYGNICLEINLDQFKIESKLPELNLKFEPQVEEYLIREYLVSVLQIENEVHIELENDGGISPYTVIVNHAIPMKHLKEYGN